jgi:signal peptidase
MIVGTALMIWKGLVLVTNSESPVVVVLSGSMEPAFYRGDVLFLTLSSAPIEIGDIVVYGRRVQTEHFFLNTYRFKIKGRDIPIVHRVLETHYPKDPKDGKVRLLTKGDNNRVDDRGLYNPGQFWLDPEDIIGRAQAYVSTRSSNRFLLMSHFFIQLGAVCRFSHHHVE